MEGAFFVVIFAGVFLPIVLMLIPWVERWRAAQDRARARHVADAKMKARLLRLNI